ncbi:MAG: GNVR domain-containing protein [Dissulfurispiraceae bacterium]|jgi:polysaccharide chain length determinant protein (PEP-CTERM system associated)|nr:GNVR domain-containing protein [Dissulfurispiraceae bacterium]
MQATGKGFDIKQYLMMIKKHRYLSLVVFLIVMSGFSWAGYFLPNKYEASSTVFVQRSSVIDPLIKGVGIAGSLDDRLRNLRDRLVSRNIIERVIKKLDLDIYARTPERYEMLIEDMRKALSITIKTPRGKEVADLFTISFTGDNPRRARDIVNTLISEYIEENMGFRRSDAYGAFEFIQTQLNDYKTKLEESDRAIRQFREKNPRMIPQNEAAVAARVESFQSAKIEGEIRLRELQRRKENLQKQLSGEKELTVAVVTKEGTPQSRLNYLESQLVIMISKYTERHPEMIRIRGEIEELKKQIESQKNEPDRTSSETSALNPIYQQLREDLAKTDAEIESLKARIQELSKQQASAQNILSSMPREQEEWVKLMRDRMVTQRIYDDLVQKLESARISKNLETTDKGDSFKIVDPAITPNIPVSPDKVKLIVMGLLLGLAAAVGAAIGIESINPSFRDEESITEMLNLPVLGSIKHIEVFDAKTAALRKRDKKIFAAAGAYTMIIVLLLVKEALYKFADINIFSF